MDHAENCGTHYTHTLRAWRVRFHQSLPRVRALGFGDRYSRMWDLYLASCEATFLDRHTGLYQMILLKNGAQRLLFNEPCPMPPAVGGLMACGGTSRPGTPASRHAGPSRRGGRELASPTVRDYAPHS